MNYRRKMSCCYFPSMVYFIDDKMTFLKNMSLNLSDRLLYQLSDKPDKTLNFLLHEYQSKLLDSQWLNELSDLENDDDSVSHHHFDIDLSAIYKTIYVPSRFRELSVVFVDYAMPSMTGLDFCRALDGKPFKKVLVTGEADHKLAVEAFNEGIIDKFILKDDSNFIHQIDESIQELQVRYFQEISDVLIKDLISNPECALNDEVFIEFFNQHCRANKIEEFYLIDDIGSYLLINAAGKIQWLIVKSVRELEEYCDIAKENDAEKTILDLLTRREKIPFFFNEEDLQAPIQNWKNYMHSAHQLRGSKGGYYYAIIDDVAGYDLDLGKIQFFKDFLRK